MHLKGYSICEGHPATVYRYASISLIASQFVYCILSDLCDQYFHGNVVVVFFSVRVNLKSALMSDALLVQLIGKRQSVF